MVFMQNFTTASLKKLDNVINYNGCLYTQLSKNTKMDDRPEDECYTFLIIFCKGRDEWHGIDAAADEGKESRRFYSGGDYYGHWTGTGTS